MTFPRTGRPIVIALALLLGGCAEALGRMAADAAYLHGAATGYVREAHQTRQEIRALCRASVARELQQLIVAGDEPALRAALRKAYPPLVTMDIIGSAIKDSGSSRTGFLSEPPGCA